MPRARSIAAGLVVVLALPAQEPKGYAFEVAGQPAEPRVWSLDGTPDRLKAGDLVEVNGALVVLGEPGTYRFRGDALREGRLSLARDGGSEAVIAIRARHLADLDAAARSRLGVVVVDAWDETTLAAVASLPLERVAITVRDDEVPKPGVMPALPRATRFLSVRLSTQDGIGDWSALARLSELRAFVMGGRWKSVDIEPLATCRGLTVLDTADHCVLDPEVLGDLVSLRHLRATWREDMDWPDLVRLRELRRLVLHGLDLRDAGVLAELPNLEHLDLDYCQLEKLPTAGFPRLRELRVGWTRLRREAVSDFRAAHPACTVTHLPEPQVLRAALAGCDRVRVRSGGTCCRSREEEKELFVERDAGKVAEVLRAIEIRDDSKTGSCMCCGDPTLEFFRGEKQVVTLSIHHASGLRWADGPWIDDAILTEASQAWLCRWLADHGVDGPQRELEERRGSSRAVAHRWRQREAVLGGKGVELLRQAAGQDSIPEALAPDKAPMASALATLAATPAERAQLAFRLLGCHEGSWNGLEPIDRRLLEWLDATWAELDAAAVLRAATADERAAIGAARFCFAHRDKEKLTEASLGAALPALVAAGLRHPVRDNRAHTLVALRGLDGEASLALLRRALAGEWTPRQVAAEDLVAVQGMVTVHPADPVRDATTAAVPALAALCLARRGDRASLPDIRALEARSTGEDKELAAQARRELEKR